MQPLLETAAVACLAAGGMLAGRWFSRRPGPSWSLGYFIPFTLVAALALARYWPKLEFMAPFSWLLAGRTEYAVGAWIGPMILATPLSRVPRQETRRLVRIFIAILIAPSLWLFLAPALNQKLQASLPTVIDKDGVCLQGTDYNCGPAAAVTALVRLGLPAEEGELAILARTTSVAGTPPDLLQEALSKRYSPTQLVSRYRRFNSLEELPKDGYTIAVTKFGFLVDHYVTILDLTDTEVVIADPLTGVVRLTRQAFKKQWRFCGITLQRPADESLLENPPIPP